MTEPARSLLVYLLSCTAALILGWFGGYRIIRRQYIKQKVAELLNPPHPPCNTQAIERQLRQIRGTLNDAHKRIAAISKGPKLNPR